MRGRKYLDSWIRLVVRRAPENVRLGRSTLSHVQPERATTESLRRSSPLPKPSRNSQPLPTAFDGEGDRCRPQKGVWQSLTDRPPTLDQTQESRACAKRNQQSRHRSGRHFMADIGEEGSQSDPKHTAVKPPGSRQCCFHSRRYLGRLFVFLLRSSIINRPMAKPTEYPIHPHLACAIKPEGHR